MPTTASSGAPVPPLSRGAQVLVVIYLISPSASYQFMEMVEVGGNNQRVCVCAPRLLALAALPAAERRRALVAAAAPRPRQQHSRRTSQVRAAAAAACAHQWSTGGCRPLPTTLQGHAAPRTARRVVALSRAPCTPPPSTCRRPPCRQPCRAMQQTRTPSLRRRTRSRCRPSLRRWWRSTITRAETCEPCLWCFAGFLVEAGCCPAASSTRLETTRRGAARLRCRCRPAAA